MKHYNIPIFVPHFGCPHDCVFCNQRRITGNQEAATPDSSRKIIDDYLEGVKPNGYVEIAFFGGSFTAIPFDEQTALLAVAKEYIDKGLVSGIRLSTRPDCIDKNILDNLLKYGVTTIELGVQSMSDDVLLKSGRGHTSKDVEKAVRLIRDYPFSLGLQMMTGLPGDTFEKSIDTANKFVLLRPDFVRIYPTLVIRDTALADMTESGVYTPMTVDNALPLLCKIKKIFDKNDINIIRIGLQTTDEISPNASVIGGPFHEAIGELVESRLYLEKLIPLIGSEKILSVRCGVGETSKVIGHRKANKEKLYKDYGVALKVTESEKINIGDLEIVEVN